MATGQVTISDSYPERAWVSTKCSYMENKMLGSKARTWRGPAHTKRKWKRWEKREWQREAAKDEE